MGLGLGLGSANLVVDELNILPLNTLALVFNLFALENVPVELRRVGGHRFVGIGSWAGWWALGMFVGRLVGRAVSRLVGIG